MIIKLILFAIEFCMLCVVTAVMGNVINAYNDPVPVLSVIISGLQVNDVIGFFLALVVVGVPVFAWKSAFQSNLFSDLPSFFESQNNRIWFAVGVVGMIGVFALEVFSFYSNALSELQNVVPCDPNNPFRPPEVCDAEIEALQQKIDRAIPYAFLISTANILIGAAVASTLKAKQEKSRWIKKAH
jgi:hypothetical protein